MASQPRTCAICPATLDPRNRTGYCARHHNHSPEKRRKISESLKRGHMLNPEWREQRRRAAKLAAQNPANRERRAQLCRERRLWELGVKGHTPETRAKIAATQSARKMAWCPPHLRAEARRLNQKQKIPAAEVRKIILDQHEAEMRRFRREIGAEEPPVSLAGCAVVRSKGRTDDETAERIIAEVAKAFRLSVAEVRNDRRMAYLIPARQTCAFILLGLGNSARQVGRWLDRDHATISHSAEQFEAKATPEMWALAKAFLETDA